MASDINPRHAVGLVFLLIVVGSGAAVGMNMFGAVIGESTTVTEQAVIVPPEHFDPSHVDVMDAVVTVNDDGTAFSTAAQAHQGESYTIQLPLHNRAEGETTLSIVMQQTDGPGHQDIEIEPTGFAELDHSCQIDSVIQVAPNEWWLTMDGECKDRIQIGLSVPADGETGFYRVQGSIKPLEEV